MVEPDGCVFALPYGDAEVIRAGPGTSGRGGRGGRWGFRVCGAVGAALRGHGCPEGTLRFSGFALAPVPLVRWRGFRAAGDGARGVGGRAAALGGVVPWVGRQRVAGVPVGESFGVGVRAGCSGWVVSSRCGVFGP